AHLALPSFPPRRSSDLTLIGLGGFEGRTLADGDVLPLGDGPVGGGGAQVPEDLVPRFGSDIEVRAVVGLCSYRLTDDALASFLRDRKSTRLNSSHVKIS